MPSNFVGMRLKGLKQLDKELQKLPLALARKIARKSMREGAKAILNQARANAPKQSGTLKRSLAITVRKRRGTKLSYDAIVHPRQQSRIYTDGAAARQAQRAKVKGARKKRKLKNDGWYAHFSEFGTKRGMRAQRWLTKAYASKRQTAVNDFARSVRKQLREVVK